MNQEYNNINTNNFDMQNNNNGISNNQALNSPNIGTNQTVFNYPGYSSENNNGVGGFNNFNPNPPKKINLGLIIGIIIVIGVVSSIVVTSVISNKKADYSGTGEEQTEQKEEQNHKKEYIYENDELEQYEDINDINAIGKIKDFYVESLNVFYLIKDGVYYRELFEEELTKVFDVGSNAKRILQCDKYSCIIENKDGKVDIYTTNYTMKNIELSGEFCYGYLGMASSRFPIITLDSEILTYQVFDLLEGTKENIEYPKISFWPRGQYEGKIKYYNRNLVLFGNNSLYTMYDVLTTTVDTPEATNVERVFINSGNIGTNPYAYTIIGQNDKVVTVDYDNTQSINLPNGYNTSNIKNIILEDYDEILIEFNDKKIFKISVDEDEVEHKYLEELSKLNVENHIIKIDYGDWEYLVLCDDGQMYELDVFI